MKKSIGLIAAAAALALLSAPAMAEKGGSKPDKPHGASNADDHGDHRENADRGRNDEHRGDDADGDDRAAGAETAKKKRNWRWPWERDN